MSRIDDLIAEQCPDGVEFRALGEVGQFIRGNGLQKKDLTDEGVGAIHYGQVFTHYGTSAYQTKSFVSRGSAERLRKARPGDLVIATTSENEEDVCKAVAWLGDAEIAASGDAFVHSHGLDPLFVAHLFQTDAFRQQKNSFITGTKVKRVSGEHLARIKIPVPPRPVQREITTTLGMMEQLEADLEARHRQYSHDRDALLDFTHVEEVPWVAFGDIATIVRGGSPRPIQAFLTDSEDGIKWIKIGDVAAGGKFITSTAEKIKPAGASKSRRVQPGDFVLSNSMSFGRPYIVQIEGCIHDGWLAIKDFADTYAPDFLYHLLRMTAVYRDLAMKAGAGTVQNLNADIVKALVLPAPALEEQGRMVAILDSFDALVNDLSIGLPAEIRARRQQYEYYRDRLLTFPELV